MEKAPEKASGSTGPTIKDKYLYLEILYGSFSKATKGVPENEFASHREKDADSRRCGRDGHKTGAYYVQTTIRGSVTARHSMMTKHRPWVTDRHAMTKHLSLRPRPHPLPCPLPNCPRWPLANTTYHSSHIAYRISTRKRMLSCFGMFEAREP